MSAINANRSQALPLAQAAERRERWNPRKLLSRAIFLVLLIGFTALFFAPFVWLVSASLKTRADVFNGEWIPDPIAWENYVRVWNVTRVPIWLKNSLIVGFLAAGAVTISCAAIAFGFSYFRFKGRDALFGVVLATMMLPGVVTMIPVYIIWNSLGVLGNLEHLPDFLRDFVHLLPLWAPNLFGSAFYIFLIRQFYLSLPRELFEAARVDGASYFGLWRYIAVPLSRTALIVVFVFEFKASWTDLLKPLIYLRDDLLFTLPRGLKAILDTFGQGGEMEWEVVMAASVIVTIPMIIIFFLGQRYFMDGIATTGLKG